MLPSEITQEKPLPLELGIKISFDIKNNYLRLDFRQNSQSKGYWLFSEKTCLETMQEVPMSREQALAYAKGQQIDTEIIVKNQWAGHRKSTK